jgi:hypothetical protein
MAWPKLRNKSSGPLITATSRAKDSDELNDKANIRWSRLTSIEGLLGDLLYRSADEAPKRVFGFAGLLLPKADRDRWIEEWLNELAMINGRIARWRFIISLVLRGAPRLALILRRANKKSGSRGAVS